MISVPTNSAGMSNGVANAPAALYDVGLVKALSRLCEVRDDGSVPILRPIKKRDEYTGIIAYESLASMISGVRTKVSDALEDGRFPLVVGGDCPVLLGCLMAANEIRGRIGLLFIDGHEDAYPAHQSPTGEAADMELGFALGLDVPELIQDMVGFSPLIKASDACMLGPRDKTTLKKFGVKSLRDKVEFYDDVYIQNSRIGDLMNDVIQRLTAKVNGLWLHVDFDVLSTQSMHAVDYQQPGGLKWGQLEEMTKMALSSGNVIGCDLTIYNPDLDPDGILGRRIVRYLENTFKT
ncbi:MAG: arginase family protein [Candidatus Nitrosotenuis sp.]